MSGARGRAGKGADHVVTGFGVKCGHLSRVIHGNDGADDGPAADSRGRGEEVPPRGHHGAVEAVHEAVPDRLGGGPSGNPERSS